MVLRHIIHGSHPFPWVSGPVEYVPRPGKSRIRIEITAKNYHQVDILADVALRDNFVSIGALNARPDHLAELGLPVIEHSFGKNFFRWAIIQSSNFCTS